MIVISTNPEKEQWDRFAEGQSAAKYSHLLAWGESLAATYSLPFYRLAAVNTVTNNLCGILPLMLFAPPRQDARLISLPYTDVAGMLTAGHLGGRELLGAAFSLADKLGANHLELRQDGALHSFFAEYKAGDAWSYSPHTFKTGLRRQLPASADELWSALSAKVRNQVRKAQCCDCVARAGGSELLAYFYAVFSENMRDLGSPVHSDELFRKLMGHDAIQTAIIVVYLKGTPAAASFVLRHNETLFNPWASSLRAFRPSCPNMLLYWSMLVYAVEQGCKWFDFGRSTPDAPTYRFKVQWGAERDRLCWHVFSRHTLGCRPVNRWFMVPGKIWIWPVPAGRARLCDAGSACEGAESG